MVHGGQQLSGGGKHELTAPLASQDHLEISNGTHGDGEGAAGDEASQAAATVDKQHDPKAQRGIKPLPAAAVLACGLLLRLAVPPPAGVTLQGWSLCSIFVSTILALVLAPLPGGACCLLAAATCIVSKTLSFQDTFAAMSNSEVIWLVVLSFFFAKGFHKTGLGRRVADYFSLLLGSSPLGLSLGLVMAEAVLAPAMPSTSARAGGIFVPVIQSLAEAAGSYPEDDRSRQLLGSFLIHSQFQASIHSSCLFLTAAAQNLLCLDLARQLGVDIPSPFFTWVYGAALPALTGLLLTPWLVHKLLPPGCSGSKGVPELETGGTVPGAPGGRGSTVPPLLRDSTVLPLSVDEKLMAAAVLLALSLWVFGPSIGVSAVAATLIGLALLLCTGVLTWHDCLTYWPAWDTLIWFSFVIGMSSQLNSLGVIPALSDSLAALLPGTTPCPAPPAPCPSSSWLPAFSLLHLLFFLLHYLFASQTAHVAALYPTFCSLMIKAGAPPLLAAMTLAYSINLVGSLTHYASGQAAAYYASGYMRLGELFAVGAANGVLALGLWAGLGMPAWKLLGWW